MMVMQSIKESMPEEKMKCDMMQEVMDEEKGEEMMAACKMDDMAMPQSLFKAPSLDVEM